MEVFFPRHYALLYSSLKIDNWFIITNELPKSELTSGILVPICGSSIAKQQRFCMKQGERGAATCWQSKILWSYYGLVIDTFWKANFKMFSQVIEARAYRKNWLTDYKPT